MADVGVRDVGATATRVDFFLEAAPPAPLDLTITVADLSHDDRELGSDSDEPAGLSIAGGPPPLIPPLPYPALSGFCRRWKPKASLPCGDEANAAAEKGAPPP